MLNQILCIPCYVAIPTSLQFQNNINTSAIFFVFHVTIIRTYYYWVYILQCYKLLRVLSNTGVTDPLIHLKLGQTELSSRDVSCVFHGLFPEISSSVNSWQLGESGIVRIRFGTKDLDIVSELQYMFWCSWNFIVITSFIK